MECIEQAKQELKENARPELKRYLDDISEYDNVFIVWPCWWGTYPMALFSQIDRLDFAGKKILPVMTHEGSGLSGFDRKLASACPDSDVLEGLAITGSKAQNDYDKCKEDVINWLNDLNYWNE